MELITVKLELEFEIESSIKALFVQANGEPTTGFIADVLDSLVDNDLLVTKVNNLSRAEIQAKLNAEAGL